MTVNQFLYLKLIMFKYIFLQREHPVVHLNMTSINPTPTGDQRNLLGFIIDAKKYSATDSRQKDITHALVLHIACDLVPFSKLDSQYFRGFVHALDQRYLVPSRKHLVSSLFQEKAASVHSEIIQQLNFAQSVGATLDIWSSRQMRSHLGISSWTGP